MEKSRKFHRIIKRSPETGNRKGGGGLRGKVPKNSARKKKGFILTGGGEKKTLWLGFEKRKKKKGEEQRERGKGDENERGAERCKKRKKRKPKFLQHGRRRTKKGWLTGGRPTKPRVVEWP